MRTWVLLVGVLVATACERPRLTEVSGEAIAVPVALEFEATALNFSRVRTLPLTNRAKVATTVAISSEPPFTAVSELVVPGGTELELEVTFTATHLGLHEGVVLINGQSVRVSGEGVDAPSCEASSVCDTARFDPDGLRCLHEPKRDGERCDDEQACVENGSCQQGVCLGHAASCDDSNPCTGDACTVGMGCRHSEVECAAPTNPCLAARCDPSLGCTSGPVVDGTPCGAVSCDEAQICLAGTCRTVTPPEGFRCAAPTMCRDEGVCHARTCVLPAPRELEPRWSYTATGSWLDFSGVSDGAGNWYWIECGQQCEAVSYTPQGFERFRTPVGRSGGGRFGTRQLLADGRFLVASGGLTAVEGATGAVVWRQFESDLLEELAEDGAGHGWALLRTAGSEVRLARFDTRTGNILGSTLLAPDARGLMLDADGRAYVVWGTPGNWQLGSFEVTGGLRFSVSCGEETPMLVTGERVVMSDDSERSTRDGSVLSPGGRWLLAGVAEVSGERVRAEWASSPTPSRSLVDRLDATHAATRLLDLELEAVEGLFLNGDGAALLASAGDESRLWLVPRQGATVSCTLRDGGRSFSASGLNGFNGSSFAVVPSVIDTFVDLPAMPPRLLFFDVGAQGVAARGWVGPHGSPTGGRRPR